MKKLTAVFTILALACGAYALEHNITFSTETYYNTYINNEVFLAMEPLVRSDAFVSYEKIRLRMNDSVDNVKFAFDGRFYLHFDARPVEYTIDSAYAQVSNEGLIAYFGKQRVKWGTGFFWNPSDLLQASKNVLNPSIDLEGMHAFRVEYSNDFITPSVIASIEPEGYKKSASENIKAAVQLYKLVNSADFFVNGIFWNEKIQSAGAAVSWDAGIAVINLEGAAIRYMDPAMSLLTMTGNRGRDEVLCRWLAGITKNMGDAFSVTAEYYRNDWGLSNREYEALLAAFLSGASQGAAHGIGMKRDYAAFNAAYVWADRLSLNMTCILGLSDGTSIIYPSIGFVENTGWDISIGLTENLSQRQNTEGFFGMPVYNIAELKFNAYF